MNPKNSSTRRFFKELRFQQLRALVEVARAKSFAGAAATLDLATPSVWQQVRGLEEEFGVELVRVSGKVVALTDDGAALADLARPLVAGFDSLHEAFAGRTDAGPKRLVLASTLQLLKNELREPLAEYRRRHPDVGLTIIDRPSAKARQALEDGEADVAVVGLLGATPGPSLVTTRLTAYPFVLLAPAGHPVLSATRPTVRAVAKHPLVLPSAAANSRSRVDEVFRRAGVADGLNVAADGSNFDLLLDLVVQGFGVSVVSVSPLILNRLASDRHGPPVVVRDLTRLFGEEAVVLLRRAGRFEPAHHRAFAEMVREACEPESNDRGAPQRRTHSRPRSRSTKVKS